MEGGGLNIIGIFMGDDTLHVGDGFIDTLIEGISPERQSHEHREECARALKRISDERPVALYGKWDKLIAILSSDNAFSRGPAMYVIASLVAVDVEHKLDRSLDAYLGLLDDQSIVVASRAAEGMGRIAKLRPDIEPRITAKLLGVESSSCKQKELLKYHVIESLGGYFDILNDKKAVIDFVKGQAESPSGKTKKAAASFLKKYAR